ncbi:hypothetical protein DPMN_085501 [Dreissena polymorpha]|uniref:Uncharacterized protein n=1 Tax=Dreissena polymorpha TaxID=45954 RepID=A0A9D4BLZ6_DREPO|nr:hypothetical protein DPMN_085501 [Dreissena polymorpha]
MNVLHSLTLTCYIAGGQTADECTAGPQSHCWRPRCGGGHVQAGVRPSGYHHVIRGFC